MAEDKDVPIKDYLEIKRIRETFVQSLEDYLVAQPEMDQWMENANAKLDNINYGVNKLIIGQHFGKDAQNRLVQIVLRAFPSGSTGMKVLSISSSREEIHAFAIIETKELLILEREEAVQVVSLEKDQDAAVYLKSLFCTRKSKHDPNYYIDKAVQYLNIFGQQYRNNVEMFRIDSQSIPDTIIVSKFGHDFEIPINVSVLEMCHIIYKQMIKKGLKIDIFD